MLFFGPVRRRKRLVARLKRRKERVDEASLLHAYNLAIGASSWFQQCNYIFARGLLLDNHSLKSCFVLAVLSGTVGKCRSIQLATLLLKAFFGVRAGVAFLKNDQNFLSFLRLRNWFQCAIQKSARSAQRRKGRAQVSFFINLYSCLLNHQARPRFLI